MDNRAIGIFDSGIGGITVLKELIDCIPNENYIYLGDTLNFPYGEKSKEDIIKFSKRNIEYLISQNVKLIVIACGTATSQSLDIMQSIFDIPIIGIIEPTVKYIKDKGITKVGIIATNGTIRSGMWESKLKSNISNIEVYSKACPLLANIVEEGTAYLKENIDIVHNYMNIFKKNNVDNIILGCTHYPIYEDILKKEFSYNVNFINTGLIVAKDVKKYLIENNIQNNEGKARLKIVVSKKEKGFDKKIKKILKCTKKLDITNFY